MIHLTDRIGNTPLLYLETLSKIIESNVYIKYEPCNPFGSAQDRTAWASIKKGLDSEKLKPGGSVIAASTGNFALSLARLCGNLHCVLYLAMPEPQNNITFTMLQQLGAVVKLTPAKEGMDGAQKAAEYMHYDVWNSYFADQVKDKEFVDVHYNTTGQEIVDQCKEYGIVPDMFISGVGTGATITGVGKKLKEMNNNINVVAVEPAESPLLSGGTAHTHSLTGIGMNFMPPILEKDIISTTIPVCFEDAMKASRRLLTKEGLSCGFTTGANLYSALLLARRPENHGKNIIIMGHDSLESHLSQLIVR